MKIEFCRNCKYRKTGGVIERILRLAVVFCLLSSWHSVDCPSLMSTCQSSRDTHVFQWPTCFTTHPQRTDVLHVTYSGWCTCATGDPGNSALSLRLVRHAAYSGWKVGRSNSGHSFIGGQSGRADIVRKLQTAVVVLYRPTWRAKKITPKEFFYFF